LERKITQPEKIALTGLALSAGNWNSLADFEEYIWSDQLNMKPSVIPTSELSKKLLDICRKALLDAGFNAGGQSFNVALMLVGKSSATNGSVKPTMPDEGLVGRLASSLGLSGPVQTFADGEKATFAALERAGSLLKQGQVEAVLLVAGANISQAVISSNDRHDCAALVFHTEQAAQKSGQKIYAMLESLALDIFPNSSKITADAIAQICRHAYKEVGLKPEETGYLEIAGGWDENSAAGLSRVFPDSAGALTCALGSGNNPTGLQPVVLGLLKTAISLYQRQIPAATTTLHNNEIIKDSAFYLPETPRPWFINGNQKRRVAGLFYRSNEGVTGFLVLSAPVKQRPRSDGKTPYQLFLLAASDFPGILQRLNWLKEQLQTGLTLPLLAKRAYSAISNFSTAPYMLALVAHNTEELAREIEKAEAGLPGSFQNGKEWKTTLGSYFTPRPLGSKAPVAFVYPGAFNSYPGLGQNLFRYYPFLQSDYEALTSQPGTAIGEKLLYPRSRTTVAPDIQEARLQADQAGMMLSGTSFAMLFTRLVRQYLKVKPAFSFGYSLGETSMLWAMEVWSGFDAGVEAFHSSSLFRTRLSGPKETIRELWKIPPEQDEFWSTYYVLASPVRVKEALQGETRVYLTHINTEEEVVISGDSAGCRRVIDRLKCRSLGTSNGAVLHCELAAAEYEDFVRFNTFPVQPVPGVTFYSTADYRPIQLNPASLPHVVSRMGCQMVDYPRLVQQVYNEGARVFVELGPGNTCSRWINKILKDREHLVVNISHKGIDESHALLKMLAKLASHRIPFDPGLLFGQTSVESLNTMPDLYPERMHENAITLAQTHARFLSLRESALNQMSELMSLHLGMLKTGRVAVKTTAPSFDGPVLFNRSQIEEFAAGSITNCFGPEYAYYENRRVARIPNTDLNFLSRIREISGERRDFNGISGIVAEYDVPADMWFYRDNSYPFMPYSVYMEIALQPCGFLSAYKGSFFLFKDTDLFFRNLDGEATLLRDVDLRGKTITTRARLLSTSTFEGTIIQRFEFECTCEGEAFYKGASAFGFFSPEAMQKQVGLDGGKTSPSWLEQNRPAVQKINLNATEARNRYFQAQPGKPYIRLAGPQLEFLDEVTIAPGSGKHGQGYIYASRTINPADWFYKCHFYQDPVMPGSLGVEAIIEAMQVFALEQNLGGQFKSPRFGQLAGHKVSWKYRGQIGPQNRLMSLEIHITCIEKSPDRVVITGDASLWKDGLRIYEVKQVALVISEA
jgi:PfaB family protein